MSLFALLPLLLLLLLYGTLFYSRQNEINSPREVIVSKKGEGGLAAGQNGTTVVFLVVRFGFAGRRLWKDGATFQEIRRSSKIEIRTGPALGVLCVVYPVVCCSSVTFATVHIKQKKEYMYYKRFLLVSFFCNFACQFRRC